MSDEQGGQVGGDQGDGGQQVAAPQQTQQAPQQFQQPPAPQQGQQVSPQQVQQLQQQLAQLQAQQRQMPGAYAGVAQAGFDEEITANLVQRAQAMGMDPVAAQQSAQGLAQFVSAVQQRQNQAAVASAEAILKADPEYGGEKYEQTLASAKDAVIALGGEELLKEIDAAGLGNSPGLIKALAKLAASGVVQGKFVAGGHARSGGEKSLAELLYGA